MLQLSTVKLLRYGKCEEVYLSSDSAGNHYVVKRFYKRELDRLKEYSVSEGRLIRKDWLTDLRRAVKIQMMMQHDRCVRCIYVDGFNPNCSDTATIKDEIDMVLEWCECGSLIESDNLSIAIPSMPAEVVKCITNDILQALEYLFAINVAHCDIKPDNIFMERNGRCKLGDFSHSQFIDSNGNVTAAKGSYYFMAPEMVSSSSEPYNGAAIDMWALGISLWMLYFRRYPFGNLSIAVMELMAEIASFDVDLQLAAMRAEGTHIEPAFENLIRAILCKDPQSRITASAALQHPWLSSINYDVATSYAASQLNAP